MNELNDRDRRILQLAEKRASYREMARDLDVGVGTVQTIVAKLVGAGLIVRPRTRMARMLMLTPQGRRVLVAEGLLKEAQR